VRRFACEDAAAIRAMACDADSKVRARRTTVLLHAWPMNSV